MAAENVTGIACVLLASLVGVLVASAGAAGAAEEPAGGAAGATDQAALVEGANAFALDLYARLADKGGNLFFSPASIDTALAMTYAGAGGSTAEQMAKTLHFSLPPAKLHAAFAADIKQLNSPGLTWEKKPAYELVIANCLWGQKGFAFKGDFLGLVKASYGAGLREVDFGDEPAARGTINKWVAEQTKDKILDLLMPGTLTPTTRLVLTNAIYFKSAWQTKFQAAATKDGKFTTADGKAVQAPMMHQTNQFGYAETEDLLALEMPYVQDELSMVILLPKSADGLPAVEKKLSPAEWGKWTQALRQARPRVDVMLPKFKVTQAFSLDRTLAAMGMPDAFDGAKADFSGMTEKEKLFIGLVIHKAFVDVDENGTEAAAATAVVMRGMAVMAQQPKVFHADHPFLFLIKHTRSGEILFVGRVTDPTAAQ
jgi:serpin B